MDLKFSLKEMEELLKNARLETKVYSEAIVNIDKCINDLENYWISKETLTYEEFKDKYLEKREQLIMAKEYMNSFCQKLEIIVREYEDASKEIKESFE